MAEGRGGGTKWEGGRATQVSPLGHAKGVRVTKNFDVVLLRVLGVLAMHNGVWDAKCFHLKKGGDLHGNILSCGGRGSEKGFRPTIFLF